MYDDVAYLIRYGAPTYDEYGNEILAETRTQIYVQPQSVYSSEFYNAGQNGLHPTITFAIANKADYSGEELIEYQGKLYTVIRPDWRAQRDAIRLICEERIKNG